jgi:two-component system, LuxR family, sensor kinase FixL
MQKTHEMELSLQEKLIFILLFFYSSIILIIDYTSPLDLNITALHIPVIVSACFLLDTKKKLYVVSFFCCSLIIIGYFVSPSINYLFDLFNRAITLVVIIVINILGKFYISNKTEEKKQFLRLKNAIESSPIAMFILNEIGTVIYANGKMKNLFHYSEDELKNINIINLVPDYLNNENLVGIRKDNSQFPLEIGLNTVTTKDKLLTIGNLTDISKRKEAEEKIVAYSLELEKSTIFLKGILDNAVDGIITIDVDGIIQSANPAIETLFGYNEEALIGKNVKMLMPTPYHEEHDGYLKNYFTTGEKKIIGLGREVSGKRNDNTVFPIQLSVSENKTENSHTFTGIIRDISREKEVLDKLKQSNEELSQFAYRTSHDLKSPLTSIRRLSDYIKEDIISNNINEAIDNIEKVASQAQKLEELVIDILDLAKADLIEDAEITPISFSSLIHQIIEKHSIIIENNAVSIIYDDIIDNKLKSEKIRINQILENLITNSIKYSDPDKKDRYVKIYTKIDHDKFSIFVEDNGLGVPNSKKEELFQIFKRFHPQAASGSGMGLAIVKRHIEKLNGSIDVTSVNEKTVFEINIPNG